MLGGIDGRSGQAVVTDVPRFLVRRESLPRTVALRPDKLAQRATGMPSDAWDAQASGVQPTRERLG